MAAAVGFARCAGNRRRSRPVDVVGTMVVRVMSHQSAAYSRRDQCHSVPLSGLLCAIGAQSLPETGGGGNFRGHHQGSRPTLLSAYAAATFSSVSVTARQGRRPPARQACRAKDAPAGLDGVGCRQVHPSAYAAHRDSSLADDACDACPCRAGGHMLDDR